MTDRLQQELHRWLAAERAEEAELAEAVLAELFQGLPRPAPRPGFARRVAARAAARWAPSTAPWPLRWAAAAILLLAGTAAVLVPLLIHRLLGDLSLAGAMESLATAVSTASRWLAAVLAAWHKAAALAAELLATPEAAAGALASVLLAALALRLLTLLFAREKGFWYASP